MISVNGQWTIQFSLGPYKDFIYPEDFHGMEIVENAGGLRPILNVSFDLADTNIIPYLNQGNIIIVTFGISETESVPMQFEIQGTGKNNEYQVGSTVKIMAAMYNPSFTSLVKTTNLESMKSFEAIKHIALTNGLKFTSNVTRSNDKQTWYRHGKTDWQLLHYIWERSYRDKNTFFSYALDCNNIFFYDMQELLKQGPKWILATDRTGTESNSHPMVNIGAYICDESNLGTMSQLAGKNVTTIGYNVDTGELTYPQHNLKTFTTMGTNKINMNTRDTGTYNYLITSGHDHPNTLEAKNQNLRNNILYSSYCVYVPVVNQYRNFKLLDCVQLIPGQPDESAAGLYFIVGIVREIKDNKFQTNLVLNRESPNNIKGDLLAQGG